MKKQHSSFMRWTSRLMMVCIFAAGMPSVASAEMVGTEQAVASAQAEQGRAKILAFIEREDVRVQMQAQGVTAEQAQARVAALTDEEVLQVSGKLEQLPAGGDVLGLLFTVFIVLLVTDILGFTKIFPFTRSIKR